MNSISPVRAKFILRIASLVAGCLVGGYGALVFFDLFDIGFQADMRSAVTDYREEISDRILSAVDEESPEVAVWALTELIDTMDDHFEGGKCDTGESELMVFSHGHLALLQKMAGDHEGYATNMRYAVFIAQLCELETLKTEKSILDSLRNRADRRRH